MPKTICLKGIELRHLNPDERTTAALLKRALAIPTTHDWSRSTPGIYARTGGLAELLQDFKHMRLLYLREDGDDIRDICRANLCGDSVFILGDHLGMSPEEEILIEKAGRGVVSLGPNSLHTDHCIVLINNELDRLEREESI